MPHQRLFQTATAAIQAVFNDQTVSHEQTLKSLELLHTQTNILINAVGRTVEIQAAIIRKKSHASTAETM